MIAWLKDVPRQYRFAPRVDGKSLVLNTVSGQADEASINTAAVSDNQVLLWDNTNKRLKSTGVTDAQLQVLNGATVGSAVASKALVVDTSKDLTGVRNLTTTGVFKAASLEMSGNAKVDSLTVTNLAEVGSLGVSGYITRDLKLNNAKITSRYNSVDYDAVSRSGSVLLFGNVSDDVKIQTAGSKNVIHRKGTNDYTVWDSSNGGHGSGMNADMLDNLHYYQFLRSDANADMYGNLILHDKYISFYNDNYYDDEMWRIRIPGSGSDYLDFYSYQANNYTLRLYPNGNAYVRGSGFYVNGNEVMNKGNDGSGSGFDADLLDGYHHNSFLHLSGGTMTGRIGLSSSGMLVAMKDNIASATDSGFFESSVASSANGWPTGSSGWYHLISSRHSNDANYYAMQLAGSFYDDNNVFLRCTAGSGTTGWKRLWHSGNDGSGSGLDADLLDGQHGSYYQNINNMSGQSEPADATHGNPKWYHVASGGAGKAMILNVVLSTTLTTEFHYLYFMSGVDQSWPIRTVRMQGSSYVYRGGDKYYHFEEAMYKSGSDQWKTVGDNTTVYFPANSRYMVIQTSGVTRMHLAMTLWITTY